MKGGGRGNIHAIQPHTMTKSYPSKYDKNPSSRTKITLSIQKLGLSSVGNRVLKKDTVYLYFSVVPKVNVMSLTTFKAGIENLLACRILLFLLVLII